MTNDNPDQNDRMTAGSRLQAGRKSVGLTVEEVAHKLNLRVSVITAIEQGEYHRIDSELFLKGYVRAYAALVDINGDSVVRQLDLELEPARKKREAEVQSSPLMLIQKRKRLKKRVAKVVLALLLLVALVYAGTFYLTWLMKEDPEVKSETPAESLTEHSGTSTTAPSVPAGAAPEAGAELADEELSADASGESLEKNDGTGLAAAETIPEDELPELAAEEELSDPATVLPAAPMVEDPDLALSAVDSVARSEAAETAGQAADDSQLLRVSFSDDCWVEVSDAGGRTLVSGLRQAGEDLEVVGEPPLNVVFGAVSAVRSVEFKGEPVDLARYPGRNNRVSFTLVP